MISFRRSVVPAGQVPEEVRVFRRRLGDIGTCGRLGRQGLGLIPDLKDNERALSVLRAGGQGRGLDGAGDLRAVVRDVGTADLEPERGEPGAGVVIGAAGDFGHGDLFRTLGDRQLDVRAFVHFGAGAQVLRDDLAGRLVAVLLDLGEGERGVARRMLDGGIVLADEVRYLHDFDIGGQRDRGRLARVDREVVFQDRDVKDACRS